MTPLFHHEDTKRLTCGGRPRSWQLEGGVSAPLPAALLRCWADQGYFQSFPMS